MNMKKIIAQLKNTRVFGSLSEAFVSAAVANAKIVDVAAGALITKVRLGSLRFQISSSAQFMQAGQVDLSADSEYSPVEMNERGSSYLPLT